MGTRGSVGSAGSAESSSTQTNLTEKEGSNVGHDEGLSRIGSRKFDIIRNANARLANPYIA